MPVPNGYYRWMTTTSDLCDDPKSVYAAACPCRDMLDLLANKWSALALGALEDGPRRFEHCAANYRA